ncbi:hypothetical protein [Edaphobacter modestus]|uniref:Uncharacterized protein n=1 Tax=Edaphobacter modestus TaxID=388466 RepID=A0A4Q7YQH3_9BACT|nr:hypothetical protein [Edaphobacter modestus]RZU39029.1 hypothetical protein BDD14_0354 [Edaphobacter modestus]
MRLGTLTLAGCLLSSTLVAVAADRNWQTGTLTATERQKIRQGSTMTTNSDSSAKDRGNGSDYSQNSTTTKTDNYENYQVYTIQSGDTIYTASEHLLFPWSKPAGITLGKPMKFAVEKGSMYILDDDGKQHKATVTGTALKQ